MKRKSLQTLTLKRETLAELASNPGIRIAGAGSIKATVCNWTEMPNLSCAGACGGGGGGGDSVPHA